MPRTKKNQSIVTQPEQRISRSFQPLLSRKDGSTRLTFAGYQHSITKDEERAFFKLIFSCLDVTRKNSVNMAILTNYKLGENKLSRTLKKIGFSIPELEIEVIDEEDEFGYQAIETDLTTQVYDYLDNHRGLVYKAQLDHDVDENNSKTGLFRINIDSLIPLIKNGEQVKDYPPEEGENNVEIDFEQVEK